MDEEIYKKITEDYGKAYADLSMEVYKTIGKELVITPYRDDLGNKLELNFPMIKDNHYAYNKKRMFHFTFEKNEQGFSEGFVSFYIQQLPGNCGILLVHDFMFICSNPAPFFSFIVKLARYLSYSQIILTNAENFEEDIFTKFGFEKVSDIRNRRSGNYIQTYLYNLGRAK